MVLFVIVCSSPHVVLDLSYALYQLPICYLLPNRGSHPMSLRCFFLVGHNHLHTHRDHHSGISSSYIHRVSYQSFCRHICRASIAQLHPSHSTSSPTVTN